MSGEDTKLNDWQNEERGAKVLSEMPSFEEHMSAKEREAELEKKEENFIWDIATTIDGRRLYGGLIVQEDKDFLTALIPGNFAGNYKDAFGNTIFEGSLASEKVLERREQLFEWTKNYFHSDKEKSLEDYLYERTAKSDDEDLRRDAYLLGERAKAWENNPDQREEMLKEGKAALDKLEKQRREHQLPNFASVLIEDEKAWSELGPDEIPDGVRDEQDYKEYLEEMTAKRIERHWAREEKRDAEQEQKFAKKLEESYERLGKQYSKSQIDGLIYERGYRTEIRDDGEEHYKEYPNGELMSFADKNRVKQPFEYMFDCGISIGDLIDGKILPDAGKGFLLSGVEDFANEYYYLTDTGYFPKFNEKYRPMSNLTSIIEKRKNGEPLSEEDRDFAYDCFPDNVAAIEGSSERVDHDCHIADRLLFGPSYIDTALLAEEAERVTHDHTGEYLDRICRINARCERAQYVSGLGQNVPEDEYEKIRSTVAESVWRNLPGILNHIDNIYDNSDGYEGDNSLREYGYLLLDNCEFGPSGIGPISWCEKGDYNKTGIGLGEAMLKCGITSDEIIDTYFGGPKRRREAAYTPTYRHLEARRAGELLRMGIPREDIIENIRQKNILGLKNADIMTVPIDQEAIEDMRKGGFTNVEILDAKQPRDLWSASERARTKYHDMGFSDEDIMRYLSRELMRLESSEE